MTSLFALCGALGFGYLSGSFPTGPFFARRRGVNLRTIGSGNVGATNAARALGWRFGLLVFLGDALKGLLPVWLFLFWAPEGGAPEVAALAAIIGHIWPFTLEFRGGKGVATAFGAFWALAPKAALISLVLWGVLALFTRKSAVGSLVAALLFPCWVLLFSARPWAAPAALIASGVIFWRHRENIERLRRGEEHEI